MIIKGSVRILRGLQANLPTLSSGELAVTTDTKKLYVGLNGANVVLNTSTTDTGGGNVGVGAFVVEDGNLYYCVNDGVTDNPFEIDEDGNLNYIIS